MFRLFLMIELALLVASSFGLARVVPTAQALEPVLSPYCFRKYLASITEHEHRPHALVMSTRRHVLREGSMYTGATREEQIAYLLNQVQGLDREEAKFILDGVFEHPQSTAETRVVFGGSRVRGNPKSTSDLDVGVYGFANNPLNKLIKKVNERFERGEFNLPMETTKVLDGNATSSIPLIVSPEEFFLRTGMRSASEGELKMFSPSGFVSVGKDGTIVYVPAPKYP
jgi:hypothetical protein